jgi:hypothetical protein
VNLFTILLLMACGVRAGAEDSLPVGGMKPAAPELSASSVTTIYPGTSRLATISVPGDIDWFTFTLNRQFVGRLRLIQGCYSAIATLYGPNSRSRQIMQTTTTDKYISNPSSFTIGPGQYFISVRGRDNNICHFGYELALDDLNLQRVKINNGAAETTSRLVMLNSTCLAPPVMYKASLSIDLYDTGWHPWAGAVPFKLNAGNSVKTVYFKVKSADGGISNVESTMIVLKETVPLALGSNWYTGNIYPHRDVDWYQFTAPAAGTYQVETQCGSLEDTVLELLDANGKIVRTSNDLEPGYASKVCAPLAAGKYTVKVYGHFMNETGTYTIRAQRVR